MNQSVALSDQRQVPARTSLLAKMAHAYDMEPAAFMATIKATVMPAGGKDVSNEQVAAFLSVANQYGLNPFTREIYAFPATGGGIQQIVSIDGWMKLINNHPQFDGMSFDDRFDDNGKLVAVTCRIYRKDRTHAIEATEYLSECARGTEPWKKWPHRMLRHKSAIQCSRYAFSFSGIVDPDEAERAFDITTSATTATAVIVPEGATRTEQLIALAKSKAQPAIESTAVVVEPAPEPEPESISQEDVAEASAPVEAAQEEDLSNPNNWPTT